MDIKDYINAFSCIAQLDKQQQFKLLEQAESIAREQLHLTAFAVFANVLPLLCIGGIAGICFASVGFTSWLPLLAIVAGMIVSRIIVSYVNRRLILRALEIALNHQPIQTPS